MVEQHLLEHALTPRKISRVATGVPGKHVANIGASQYASFIVAESGEAYCSGLNNYG